MNLRYEREAVQSNEEFKNCQLIWHPSQVETYYDKPINSYCHFRKTFNLEKLPKIATVRIFADTRYALYINGEYIAKGPSRSDPRWQYYDEIEVSDKLKEGQNVFAVLVLHFGYGSGQSMHRIPALFLQCKMMYSEAKEEEFSTDETWKAMLSTAYDSEAPRINGCKGPVEIFDNRYHPQGWENVDFDDSMWNFAKGRSALLSPFWNLKKRPIPMLVEKDLDAKSIIAAGVGSEVKGYDKKHLHYQLKEEIANIEFAHVYVLGTECELKPVDKGSFSYLLIDFEKVEVGYLNLDVTGYSGDIVDVVYAEELLDGKPEINGISYRPISRFILKDGENKLKIAFDYEAFRYVMLIFRNNIRSNLLNSVKITTKSYPMDNESTFTCDNKNLNKLWEISVHTLKLCMQDGFLDSPSREQQQWMGDGRYQAIINNYVSGDTRMIKKLLLQLAQSQDFEGMTTSRYPDENHNLPPIPSFCLQWINAFGDLYDFTGETELAKKLWNSIISAMRWFSGFENQYGLLENVPYWQYFDPGKGADYSGSVIGILNIMYVEAMNTVIKLASLIDDSDAEKFFKGKVKRLKKEIRYQLWDNEAGAYVDCLINGEKSDVISEGTNLMAILNLHDVGESRIQQIIDRVFDSKTRQDVVFVSPYFMLPYAKAMKKAGRNDIAYNEFLARYKPMLDSGATSTWEDWDRYYEKDGVKYPYSACHGWGAATVVLVAENILGIDLFSKKEVKVEPEIMELCDIKAKIVTTKGTFIIEAENNKITKKWIEN